MGGEKDNLKNPFDLIINTAKKTFNGWALLLNIKLLHLIQTFVKLSMYYQHYNYYKSFYLFIVNLFFFLSKFVALILTG